MSERFLQPVDRLHEHLGYMDELPPITPDMRTVISAAQWLTTAPETHNGESGSNYYTVCELAGTGTSFRLGPTGGLYRMPNEGIYFGRIENYRSVYGVPEFRVSPDRHTDGPTEASLRLVDVNDPDSFDDRIHVTVCSRCSSPTANLWFGGAWVDIKRLAREPEERLDRMARNAIRVLGHYGIEAVD